MAEPVKYENGELYVWTGAGYHQIPKIAAGDVGDLTREETERRYTQGDGDERVERDAAFNGWGISDLSGYDSIAPLHPWRNFSLQPGGTQDAFSYRLKSGDKEGSLITFKRDGDYYVPTYTGTEYWDTNESKKNMALASIVAAAVGGAYLSQAAGGASAAGSAASGAGTMATYGVLDTSLALPGTQFVSGVAAATPSVMNTYGIVDKSLALPGTQFTPGIPASSPGVLDRLSDAYKSPIGKAVSSVAQLAGGLGGEVPTEGVVPVDQEVPASGGSPANVQVGNVGVGGIPTGVGGRKPGAVTVPDFDPYAIRAPAAPAAPGVINSQFKF